MSEHQINIQGNRTLDCEIDHRAGPRSPPKSLSKMADFSTSSVGSVTLGWSEKRDLFSPMVIGWGRACLEIDPNKTFLLRTVSVIDVANELIKLSIFRPETRSPKHCPQSF